MSRNEVIEYIYNLKIVEKCASRFSNIIGQYKEDFIQYIYLQLLEIPEDKLLDLFSKGELVYYIIAISRNNALGRYSNFFKEIREKNIELYEDEKVLQQRRFEGIVEG